MNSAAINHTMRPMSLPVAGQIPTPMPVPNSANQDLHTKQTIDRLCCIQKHLKNPALFSRTIRELIEWCSDERAFGPQFHPCLLDCLTVVNDVVGNPGFDVDLCYKLLHLCYEQRDKFANSAASMLAVWFRRAQNVMINKRPTHLDQVNLNMGNQPLGPGPSQFNNNLMNAKYPPHVNTRIPDQPIWNRSSSQQAPPHPNQHSSLSVITTATVWGVSTTQTPPVPVHSQSSSFHQQHLNHSAPALAGDANYMNNYPNKPVMNDSYQQHGLAGGQPGRMTPQRHHINADQSHHSSAAAAAAAAVAAAAAAATATATATATFIKEHHQDPNQINNFEQMPPTLPPSMSESPLDLGMTNQQHMGSGAHQPGNRMRPQVPQYGRAQSVPTSFPISSPHPLSHNPPPTYHSDGYKSGRPPSMQYNNTSFNGNSNQFNKTPDPLSHCHPSSEVGGPGYCSRVPGPSTQAVGPQNHFYPQQAQSQQHSDPFMTPHGNRSQFLPHSANDMRFCNSQPPSIPGNPTPPLTPGSAHNVPPYPGMGQGAMNESGAQTEPFFPPFVNSRMQPTTTEPDELRLTFPVRDGIVLRPFRLEHNLAVSNHAFHLREHVHKTLFARYCCGQTGCSNNNVCCVRLHKLPRAQKRTKIQAVPDLDLQFKCYHHDDVMKHTNWPHSVQVRVNSTPMAVPRGLDRSPHKPLYLKRVCGAGRNNIEISVSACCCLQVVAIDRERLISKKQNDKASAEGARLPKEAMLLRDIFKFTKPSLDTFCSFGQNSHFFVLQLVHRPSIRFVLKGLIMKRINPDASCRTKIKRNFSTGAVATNDVMLDGPSGGGAVDPMVAMVRISLLCPITGRRMRIPARGQDCKHIQCFGLEPYLQLNIENATWTCPLCQKMALLERLEVDEFMQNILKSALDCTEVSIDAYCNWSPIRGALSAPYPRTFPRSVSVPGEGGTQIANGYIKQEVKQEATITGFGPSHDQYISALSIKKESHRHDFSIKPDPDAPPAKRLRSVTSPGINLNNLPAPSPGSSKGCTKVEQVSGFPQSYGVSKFGAPPQPQRSPVGGGIARSGSLMIADTKEHIAANDMVPIEKRLNPAVSQNNAAMATSTSPNRGSSCFDNNKTNRAPSTPIHPTSSSAALTPHSVGSTNCPFSSSSNSITIPTSSSNELPDLGRSGGGAGNPSTPVVSLPEREAFSFIDDSSFESILDNQLFGDSLSSKDPPTTSLPLKPMVSNDNAGPVQRGSEDNSTNDLMDILSGLDADNNPANADEDSILSMFGVTS